jgi:hypothetical protein
MISKLKNRIVSLLGWLILQLVDETGALKHIYRIQVKLKVTDPNCSVQLALLVTDSDKTSCFFDLTHGRFLRGKCGQKFVVKGGHGFALDEGGLDQIDSPELFAFRLSMVSKYVFKKFA